MGIVERNLLLTRDELAELGRDVDREYTRPLGRNGRPLTNMEMIAVIEWMRRERDRTLAEWGCCNHRDQWGVCLASGKRCQLVQQALRIMGES